MEPLGIERPFPNEKSRRVEEPTEKVLLFFLREVPVQKFQKTIELGSCRSARVDRVFTGEADRIGIEMVDRLQRLSRVRLFFPWKKCSWIRGSIESTNREISVAFHWGGKK